MTDLLGRIQADRESLLGTLENLVLLESPSSSKTLVDRLGRLVADRLEQSGFRAVVEPRSSVGDIIWGEWPADPGRGRILVLCHLDTVHPAGSLDRNPWKREGVRLCGPGVYDMKASVAATLLLQQYLQSGIIHPGKSIRFLYTTDEEIGSFESRAIIESFARESDIALVLEPPLPDGALKVARKGSGVFRVRARGRAAHAGVAPEQGINAITELSRQIPEIEKLANPEAGTTVSVTMIGGGTAENVIPESAEATIDVRFLTVEEARRVESAIRSLSPVTPGAEVRVEGQLDRPPMEQSQRARDLFEQVRRLGAGIGLELCAGFSGGGSDGSFTAAQGVPTIDGLGIEGGGAHSPDEYIFVDSLLRRTALLGVLLEQL